MNGTHLIGLTITRAETISQCVPRKCNFVSEAFLWIVGSSLLIAGLVIGTAWLYARATDKYYSRKVNS